MIEARRGKLKIYMGYAAGVGKTYQMLEEARALHASGADVVIGYFESHGRQDTIAKAAQLELVPRRKIEYRGALFEEMDVDAILARRPRVCAVDEFPHTNIPGSGLSKRWEDVEVLLEAGIDVLTTMNIQHLESLNDQVWQITGVRVRETIPDWVVQKADEVVMIDLTPRALLHRLQRGVVYGREKAERAMQNFFRESTLVALRELALRQTAHEVEHRFVDEHSLDQPSDGLVAPASGGPHRIAILVTASPESAMLIRRARRVADFLGAECFAVAVQPSGALDGLRESDRDRLEQHLNFARNLHIETRILKSADVPSALIAFARANHVSQIFLARSHTRGWCRPLFSRDPIAGIVNLARDMQVVIVSERLPAR